MLALGIAVFAVSTSAILIRVSDAPKPAMAFYRVLFTTVLLLPFLRGHTGAIQRIRRRDLLSAIVAGVALAAHFATWFESVDRTTIAASVTLVQTTPVFVAIGATALLDERPTRHTIAGIAIVAVGSVVMSAGGLLATATVPAPVLGNALAIAGAIMAAAYVLAGRSIRQRVSLIPYVLVVYTVCTTVLLGYVLAVGDPLLGYPPREWLLFLGMAIGPGILGHTVINWSLKYVESSVVSVTLVGEPVGSTLLALAIFAEVPGIATLVGGAVVLTGIVLTARGRPA
ncbi:MAG: DMT family transporter [Halobacteriaceae archaeon]